jgi:hypothetical protein
MAMAMTMAMGAGIEDGQGREAGKEKNVYCEMCDWQTPSRQTGLVRVAPVPGKDMT